MDSWWCGGCGGVDGSCEQISFVRDPPRTALPRTWQQDLELGGDGDRIRMDPKHRRWPNASMAFGDIKA